MKSNFLALAFLGLAMVCGDAFAVEAVGSAPMPRYRLHVGQEITYRGSATVRGSEVASHAVVQATVWVLRALPGGGWRIGVNREQTTVSRGNDQTHVDFEQFDLMPDGRISSADARPTQFTDVSDIFIPLPSDVTAAASWEQSGDAGAHSTYQLLANTPDEARIERVDRGLTEEIYEIANKTTIRFSPNQGLVTQTQGQMSQRDNNSTHEIHLVGSADKSAEWIQTLTHEAELLTQTRQALWQTLEAVRAKGDGTASREAADKLLDQNRALATVPIIQVQFTALAEMWTNGVRAIDDESSELASMVGQPAPNWTTTDLDGNKHTLADYRGKVVVLDFWYRGCVWCIRAMPEIKKVVEHYHDHPVAILGMNTDKKDSDARFVLNKLKLNYPTLHAQEIPEAYHVSGYPTFVIIDPNGKVAAYHVGYALDLENVMREKIEAALLGRSIGG
jgi:peroxiredoxin